MMGFGKVPAFKTMRTLRALRPLRAMSRLEGMRVSRSGMIAEHCRAALVCYRQLSFLGVRLIVELFGELLLRNVAACLRELPEAGLVIRAPLERNHQSELDSMIGFEADLSMRA